MYDALRIFDALVVVQVAVLVGVMAWWVISKESLTKSLSDQIVVDDLDSESYTDSLIDVIIPPFHRNGRRATAVKPKHSVVECIMIGLAMDRNGLQAYANRYGPVQFSPTAYPFNIIGHKRFHDEETANGLLEADLTDIGEAIKSTCKLTVQNRDWVLLPLELLRLRTLIRGHPDSDAVADMCRTILVAPDFYHQLAMMVAPRDVPFLDFIVDTVQYLHPYPQLYQVFPEVINNLLKYLTGEHEPVFSFQHYDAVLRTLVLISGAKGPLVLEAVVRVLCSFVQQVPSCHDAVDLLVAHLLTEICRYHMHNLSEDGHEAVQELFTKYLCEDGAHSDEVKRAFSQALLQYRGSSVQGSMWKLRVALGGRVMQRV